MIDSKFFQFLPLLLLQDYHRELVMDEYSRSITNPPQKSSDRLREIRTLEKTGFFFLAVVLLGLFMGTKSYIQELRELIRRQKLQKNPDLFCETSESEGNTTDPETPIDPTNRSPDIETRRTAFLPYPNTGTCYQAPASNPV